MKIAVDLDDVLTDTMGGVVAYYNNEHSTSFIRKDFVTSDFWKIWGGTKEGAVKEILGFHNSDYGIHMLPTEEALSGIQALKESGQELYVVTGRYDEVMDDTHRWITKFFPKTFRGIFNTNHFSLTTQPITKAEVCKKLGITLLIDDNLDHALDCAQKGIMVLLVDQPWNQLAVEPENIHRVFDWLEITQYISSLSFL